MKPQPTPLLIILTVAALVAVTFYGCVGRLVP
jgi:hypothetical protein